MTTGRLPDLHAFVQKLQEAAPQLATDIANDVRQFAPVYKGPDPRRTGGAYQAEVTGEASNLDNGVQITIKAPAPLTQWIIEGTPGHVISPKMQPSGRMGRLVFYVQSGEIIFMPPGRSIEHPGTQPNPYPLQAMGLIEGKIESAVLSVMMGTAVQ